MAGEFFTDEQNLAELVTHMPEDDQTRFNAYGHFRVEAVFVDRVFIIYKPTGLNSLKRHNEPEILNTVRVTDFGVNARTGCTATLRDEKLGQEMTVTHVPKRLFNYPVFVSVPPRITLRWDCRTVNGRPWRSMSFALLIKTKNKSDFYSKGNTYVETPNQFKRLYPHVTGEFRF